MSILIKGMEMPQNCDRCFFCQYIHADEDHERFYVCSLENWKKPITHLPLNPIQAKSKPNWCPLIEVPTPHGRLIDADALMKKGMPLSFSVQKWVQEVDIACAPTIIEAEVDNG